MSVKTIEENDKILAIANRLALFRRDTQDPNYFINYLEFSERADTSIKRSALYCFYIFYSDYFRIHELREESIVLHNYLGQFLYKTKISNSTISDKIEEIKKLLELIILQAEDTKFSDNLTGRKKAIRTRYLAAIVGNCYHDKFAKWPSKTPKGSATQDFINCVDNICEILDPREPRASSDSCTEFLEKPWHLWADKEIPMLKTM